VSDVERRCPCWPNPCNRTAKFDRPTKVAGPLPEHAGLLVPGTQRETLSITSATVDCLTQVLPRSCAQSAVADSEFVARTRRAEVIGQARNRDRRKSESPSVVSRASTLRKWGGSVAFASLTTTVSIPLPPEKQVRAIDRDAVHIGKSQGASCWTSVSGVSSARSYTNG